MNLGLISGFASWWEEARYMPTTTDKICEIVFTCWDVLEEQKHSCLEQFRRRLSCLGWMNQGKGGYGAIWRGR